MKHPEADGFAAGDISVWDELRLKRFCDALDKSSHAEVLHMAKTLAQAVIVAHPAAVRLLILSGIQGSDHYAVMARGVMQGIGEEKANEKGPA